MLLDHTAKGVYAIAVTPFKADGAVDYDDPLLLLVADEREMRIEEGSPLAIIRVHRRKGPSHRSLFGPEKSTSVHECLRSIDRYAPFSGTVRTSRVGIRAVSGARMSIRHRINLPQNGCWLEWNAATECNNNMLPLAGFPKNY